MLDKDSKMQYFSLCFFLTRAFFIGNSLNNLIAFSKQDSWLSLIIGFIMGLVPLFIFIKISSYKPELNVVDKINDLFGAKGKIINIILGLCVLFLCVLNFWTLTNFTSSQYLNKTPTIIIGITFLFVIIYALSKGIKVIGRFSLILLYGFIILFIVSVIGLFNQVSLDNLKPFLQNDLLKGAISFFTYNCLSLFLILIIPQKNAAKTMAMGCIVSGISLLIQLAFVICIFGAPLASIYQFPGFYTLKQVSFFTTGSSIEGILSIQWFFDLIIFIIVGIYYVNKSLSIKIPYIVPIVVLALSEYIFKNNTIGNVYIKNIFPYIIPIILFIIPIIIWHKININKKNKKS